MMQVQNKEKQPDEAWVRKNPEKVPTFDVRREKETFMEAKKDFVDLRTSVAPAQQHQQQLQSQEALTDQVSTLSSFLQSCMKLLRNQNALNELKKVISSCKPQRSSDKGKTVNRVRRTGREMRLHKGFPLQCWVEVVATIFFFP